MGTGAFGRRLYIFVGMGSWGWERFGGIPHGAWDNYVFGTLFFFEGGDRSIWMGAWGQEHMGILIFSVVCFQT